MKTETLSMKNIIKQLDFLKKKVIVHWNPLKKKGYCCLLTNTADQRNAKEQYESFLRKKNKKSVKQSAIFTYRPNTFQNPNFVDIKLDIIEHPKTSQKLSNTIRKGEKVDSNSTLYSDPKKLQIFWTEKM